MLKSADVILCFGEENLDLFVKTSYLPNNRLDSYNYFTK
jgi:hypothetical protein